MDKLKLMLLKLLLPKGVKDMIEKFKNALAGKRSYLAAIGLLITALIEFSNDSDISKLITRIFEALAIAGIRASIK